MTSRTAVQCLALLLLLSAVAMATRADDPAVVTASSINQTLAMAGSTLEALRSLNAMLGGGGVGDGCAHSCSNGRQPVPKPGYRPTFNGCGSAEFKVDTSNLPGITSCCNQHDICYGTCNSPKSACEEKFRVCLIHACDSMRASGRLPDAKAHETCRNLGDVFHDTVVNFGCDFYLDAQEEACTCGEDEKPKDTPSQQAEDVEVNGRKESSFQDFDTAHKDSEGGEL